jgi:O-antigen/teichoic acid export membrane protein
VNTIHKILNLNDSKSKTVALNVFYSFFIKAINILVSFLTIPLVLSFLNTTQYGIWLTLTAILGWFSLFDLGFGNGLRNHLTTAIATNNHVDGRMYVSTTYAAMTVIFGFLLLFFFIAYPFINWQTVFNAPLDMRDDIKQAVLYATSLLLIQFVLRLINTVLLAFQRSAMANFTNALVQVGILVGLYILKIAGYHSLTAVSVVYSIMPVVVFLVFTFILFSKSYKHISPSLAYVKFQHAKGLLNIGLTFFVIQIAALVIYASDNFIISQLFSPSEVTTYNIAFKYFSIGNVLFTIVLAPFWSMTTKAYSEKDFTWIKTTMKKLYMFWIFLLVINVIQLFVSNPLYRFWTHNAVIVPFSLSIVMCVYYIVLTWGAIFSNFLNGVGKIKLQLYFATASMILNIPLAVIFIKVFHFGVVGIPLATIIITSFVSVISYIQYKKIIGLTATGIWNK